LGLQERSALNAATSTGATQRRPPPAATPSKFQKTNAESCIGQYTFINNGVGKGDKITFAEAWQGFEKSLTSARIPCTSIKRYPVVARWRNDVDFVAAGIFCF
jgi:alanyl-tRNA synthetase